MNNPWRHLPHERPLVLPHDEPAIRLFNDRWTPQQPGDKTPEAFDLRVDRLS